GISLTRDMTPGSRTHVRADRQRLKQILVNLVGNAVKYNRTGGSVTVASGEGADRFVRIRVVDTGAGIPPNKMELLFQPFERLGAERDGVEGTGLGLAVSKGLATAMGGALGVESIVGRGTTFWVDVPPAAAPSSSSADEGQSDHASQDRSDLAGVVLYIEDNAS